MKLSKHEYLFIYILLSWLVAVIQLYSEVVLRSFGVIKLFGHREPWKVIANKSVNELHWISLRNQNLKSLFFSINPNRKNVNRKGGLIKVPSPGTITGNYKQVKACHQNLFCIITRLNDIITINVNVNSLTLIPSLDFHAVIWLVHPIFTTTLVTPCLMIYFDLNRFIQTKTVSLSSKFWIDFIILIVNKLQ